MDVWHTHRDLRFVWDAEKAASNVRDHGISFENACEVFLDPFVRVVDASRNQEARDKAIGYTADTDSLLCVVHILIEDDAIRIISAWSASPTERKQYEDY